MFQILKPRKIFGFHSLHVLCLIESSAILEKDGEMQMLRDIIGAKMSALHNLWERFDLNAWHTLIKLLTDDRKALKVKRESYYCNRFTC